MPLNPFASIRAWGEARLSAAREAVGVHYSAKLGVLGIMKNEAMILDEWIDHYLWMGAG